MLICPKETKEHESIVSINAESWQVHAALVAIGSSPGVPCRWAPEYTPAWGPTIEIEMMWRDAKTKEIKTIDAKQWILNSDTQKPMTTPQPRYQANDGELICLANFSTSTIDLHVSKEDTDIFFEANTPLIPPINTQVYTIIKPGPVGYFYSFGDGHLHKSTTVLNLPFLLQSNQPAAIAAAKLDCIPWIPRS